MLSQLKQLERSINQSFEIRANAIFNDFIREKIIIFLNKISFQFKRFTYFQIISDKKYIGNSYLHHVDCLIAGVIYLQELFHYLTNE